MQESREDLLKKIKRENWDIIVVGGGITGAGILREAVRRNLKVLLLEQRDFAWGTSSRSTKMVHGGLRYLKEGDFALTRESVLERENLINELPGLVTNKGFILPFYKEKLLQRLIIYIGLIVYDFLALRWRKHVYSLKDMERLAPHIGKKNLKGGFCINDAVTDDARLVFRVLSEA
ncbi:FAD-dependent oxidoreductase, partial [bacterium]|nr:FAD-dependent oxidoreductase [bacterium]